MNKDNMEVKFSKLFAKQYNKAGKKIQTTFELCLADFIQNPHKLTLRNHSLKGKYIGLRSINVTGDWRALYSERNEKNKTIVIFELLGTHSQLYK